MTIKQNGGIFGRNPTFNDLTVQGTLTQTGSASFTQVGIDVSSPTEALHVNGNIILNDGSFGSGDSHNLILGDKNAYMQSTHGQPLNFGAYHGFVFGRATASNLTIATEQVRIDADGLKFNGDTAAANALDDYEEGTWTPTVTSTSGTITTLDNVEGFYTKIGRQVTVQAHATTTNNGTGAGVLRFTGLPYTPVSTDMSGTGFIGVGYNSSSGKTLRGRITGGNDRIDVTNVDGTYPTANGRSNSIQVTYYVS